MKGSISAPFASSTASGSLWSHSGRAGKYSRLAPSIEKPKWWMRSGVLITHSPTTRSPTLETRHVLADFDDLADPFVAGDDRIGNRDDVLAGEKLVVRMADTDATRTDHHFICR